MEDTRQQKILEEAITFIKSEVEPLAKSIDEKEAVPRELIDKMAERGYLGAALPEKYDGLGLDPYYYGRLTEEFGKVCSSTRALLTVHTSLCGETLLLRGTEEQKEKYLHDMAKGKKIMCFALSEPDVGSDANGVKTSYIEEGDHFVINGTKKWISYSGIADLFLVLAACGDKKTAFIIEKEYEGIEIKPIRGLLGSRGAYISEIKFANVIVPKENLVGREGNGFSFIANTALYYGRYSIAWGSLGIAQAALEHMMNYAKTRTQFGQPIGKNQLVEEMLADSYTEVKVSRCFCEELARKKKNNHKDIIMETNIAKYYTSIIAVKVTNRAVQIWGGNGCWAEYPVERLFREAKIMEIIEGTSQMQQLMIAKYGLKKLERTRTER